MRLITVDRKCVIKAKLLNLFFCHSAHTLVHIFFGNPWLVFLALGGPVRRGGGVGPAAAASCGCGPAGHRSLGNTGRGWGEGSAPPRTASRVYSTRRLPVQVVFQPQHHHRAHAPSQHAVHAVPSQRLLLPRPLQTGKGEPRLAVGRGNHNPGVVCT